MIDIDYYLNQLGKNNFVIFLFHGVVEHSNYEVRNYTKKHLRKNEFEKFIEGLKLKGNPISMEEVLFNYQNKIKYRPFSYAITFDDGFENNYTNAAPILDNYNQKATFYISTDLIENNTITWTDKIEFCLENIQCGVIKLPWEIDEISFTDKITKISIMKNLRNYLKSNLDINPSEIVDYFYKKFKIDPKECGNSELDKKMNWDQVKNLNNHSNFIVAGHSNRHLSLTSLSSNDLEKEIETSLKLLSEKGHVRSHHYSYPEGQEIDYSDNVIKCLKEKEIKCCPTAIPGVNNNKTNLFHLKRIMVD